MEIGPIAGIRVMPINKVRPVDPELSTAFDIESPARPEDDDHSSALGRAAGAEESEDDLEEEEDSEVEDVEPAAAFDSGRISIFA